MNYIKQTWAAGDKITSAKLNHMEDGISNIVKFIAIQYPNDPAAEHPYIEYSYSDIVGYINNGTLVIITEQAPQGIIVNFISDYANTGSAYVVGIDKHTWLQAATDTENMDVYYFYSSGGTNGDLPPK